MPYTIFRVTEWENKSRVIASNYIYIFAKQEVALFNGNSCHVLCGDISTALFKENTFSALQNENMNAGKIAECVPRENHSKRLGIHQVFK